MNPPRPSVFLPRLGKHARITYCMRVIIIIRDSPASARCRHSPAQARGHEYYHCYQQVHRHETPCKHLQLSADDERVERQQARAEDAPAALITLLRKYRLSASLYTDGGETTYERARTAVAERGL